MCNKHERYALFVLPALVYRFFYTIIACKRHYAPNACRAILKMPASVKLCLHLLF